MRVDGADRCACEPGPQGSASAQRYITLDIELRYITLGHGYGVHLYSRRGPTLQPPGHRAMNRGFSQVPGLQKIAPRPHLATAGARCASPPRLVVPPRAPPRREKGGGCGDRAVKSQSGHRTGLRRGLRSPRRGLCGTCSHSARARDSAAEADSRRHDRLLWVGPLALALALVNVHF